jgi:hypothetical protein
MMTLETLLGGLARTIGALPRNRSLWAYTIMGVDGSPYITRAFGPRVRGWRPLLHRIHRPDADRAPHNHPWRRARFIVASGGYVEERLTDRGPVRRQLSVGDVNVLDADVYHRIIQVLPDT